MSPAWGPEITAALELAMGLALVMGAMLARKGRYRAHAWCQAAVVLLNLWVVAAGMVPVYHRRVIAALSTGSLSLRYLLTTIHGATGILAELFAVYILLAAGTRLLPKRLRFADYKSWMRGALALWWLVLLLGLAVYVS